jgi:hypothetical protein
VLHGFLNYGGVKCVVYIRGGWEKRFMVTHEKANGRSELQGSMKHDEIDDMECLVPMRKKVY